MQDNEVDIELCIVDAVAATHAATCDWIRQIARTEPSSHTCKSFGDVVSPWTTCTICDPIRSNNHSPDVVIESQDKQQTYLPSQQLKV